MQDEDRNPLLCGRVPKEDAAEFKELARRLQIPPGRLVRLSVQFVLRIAREMKDDEAVRYLLERGEEDADQV